MQWSQNAICAKSIETTAEDVALLDDSIVCERAADYFNIALCRLIIECTSSGRLAVLEYGILNVTSEWVVPDFLNSQIAH